MLKIEIRRYLILVLHIFLFYFSKIFNTRIKYLLIGIHPVLYDGLFDTYLRTKSVLRFCYSTKGVLFSTRDQGNGQVSDLQAHLGKYPRNQ
jgi:hypothetical protein